MNLFRKTYGTSKTTLGIASEETVAIHQEMLKKKRELHTLETKIKKNKNKTVDRINAILSQLEKIDNDRVDAIRLLCVYLEDNKDVSCNRLMKFLKNSKPKR